jgi:hypothetical protein
MNIENIDQIQSIELSNDIKSLCLELLKKSIEIDHIDRSRKASLNPLWKIIQDHIMGVGHPICICDGGLYFKGDDIIAELLINYQVTYGYKPYQDLNNPIHIFFTINQSIMRDLKIDKIFQQ